MGEGIRHTTAACSCEFISVRDVEDGITIKIYCHKCGYIKYQISPSIPVLVAMENIAKDEYGLVEVALQAPDGTIKGFSEFKPVLR